jgi:cold shock protein
MNGAVTAYDRRRGVGALTPDDGSADVAVHASEVERAGLARLSVGDRFSFDVQTDRARGRSFAVNLAAL